MNREHKTLAAGAWRRLSFLEQMANIGSEVERAINWRNKKNPDYAQRAFQRALELLDLTIENLTVDSRLKEMTRLREVLLDFFLGENKFCSTESCLQKYFLQFAYACRKNKQANTEKEKNL